jgi:hypothetical protein
MLNRITIIFEILGAMIFMSAGNVFAVKSNGFKENKHFPFILSNIINQKASLSKSMSSPSIITRMVRDSVAIYDYIKGAYMPGAVLTYTYSNNGFITSLEQDILNDSLASEASFINVKNLFSTDASGNITETIVQIWSNNKWNNSDKEMETPYLSHSYTANGYYHYSTCQSVGFFCTVSQSDQQWDTLTNKWTNYIRDTLIIKTNNMAVVLFQTWDAVKNSFITKQLDSIFFSENHVNKAIITNYFDSDTTKSVYSGIYNENGDEIEDTQLFYTWNSQSTNWEYYCKIKHFQSYDSHGNLIQAIEQDSIDHLVPLDSCGKFIFAYTYDNSGNIITRVDSINWHDFSPKQIHFYKYQTFPLAAMPNKML